MTVNEIIALAHTFAGTTSSQISDTLMLQFVNLAYHHAEERIRNEINEDYFYDYFTTSTIVDQNEYVLPAPWSNTVGILKAIGAGIKYTSSITEYQPIRPFGSGSLYTTDELTQLNQSVSDPFYIIKDYSIFIYPSPTEFSWVYDNDWNPISVANWLRVHASVNLIDLIAGWSEATIKIPRNYHEALALKAATYAYLNRSLGGTAIAQDTDVRAIRSLDMMIDNMKDRNLQPMEQDLPSLTNLQW